MPVSQNLCYNCFRERQDITGACPYCGYDDIENREKYPTALRAGSILNGQYIVGRVLGQGGFGITYLALDYQLNIKVAIKEYIPDGMATRLPETTLVSAYAGEKQDNFNYGAERFLDEARVLAKFIGNKNIAGVKSYFSENNTAYFVMDYIEGISFKNYVKNKGGKVDYTDALRVLLPVMDALAAVHREGFIHRDVTPDNIYITKDNEIKLLDFGSARYSLGDKSKSLDVILKAGYAPKEQYIRRGKQGPYTDIYSLAACFYAGITGYLPPEALERMEEDEIIPISTRRIKIPDNLEDAIMKGLEVKAEDRWQSVEEFKAAIEEGQSGGAVPAAVEADASVMTITSQEPLGQRIVAPQLSVMSPQTPEVPDTATMGAPGVLSAPADRGWSVGKLRRRRRFILAAAVYIVLFGVIWGRVVFEIENSMISLDLGPAVTAMCIALFIVSWRLVSASIAASQRSTTPPQTPEGSDAVTAQDLGTLHGSAGRRRSIGKLRRRRWFIPAAAVAYIVVFIAIWDKVIFAALYGRVGLYFFPVAAAVCIVLFAVIWREVLFTTLSGRVSLYFIPMAVVAVYMFAISWRDVFYQIRSGFAAVYVVDFFIPMVAAALCIILFVVSWRVVFSSRMRRIENLRRRRWFIPAAAVVYIVLFSVIWWITFSAIHNIMLALFYF